MTYSVLPGGVLLIAKPAAAEVRANMAHCRGTGKGGTYISDTHDTRADDHSVHDVCSSPNGDLATVASDNRVVPECTNKTDSIDTGGVWTLIRLTAAPACRIWAGASG